MDKPVIFQCGDRTIDLSNVVAFLEAPQPTFALAENMAVMVHMFDGSNTTIYGDRDSQAFTRAMDDYLCVNLT